MDITKHIKEAFKDADQNKSKVSDHTLNLNGMCGAKTLHLYNNLCNMPSTNYLEIGMYKGKTFCAAAENNEGIFIGMDNWSQFDGAPAKNECVQNINFGRGQNASIDNEMHWIESDCWDHRVTEFLTEKVEDFPGKAFNVYMFDGPHEVYHHEDALTKYIDLMADEFIFIVDDFERGKEILEPAKEGTERAIEKLGLEVVYHESRMGGDMNPDKPLRTDWWDGVGVYFLRKPNKAK